jgi:hypothetical protein
LIINGREFIWYVKDDPDSADMVLHVAAQDKIFMVNYHLAQPVNTRYLIVLGKEFPGLPDAGGCWIRVLCPEWETDSIVTPASVRRLIEWCLSEKCELIRVNHMGLPIDS